MTARAERGSRLTLAPLPGRVNHSDQAHATLRGAITSGELAPGGIYSVAALAEQLGVSRTPVREALLQLARQGLVQPVRNRGFAVVEASIQDLRDIFEIRLLLEPPATLTASRKLGVEGLGQLRVEYEAMIRAARAGDSERMWRHDRAFHRDIMTASGNTRLAHYIESLRDFVQTRGKLTTRTRQLMAIAAEHEPIMSALEERRGADARAAMRRHITATRDALIAQEGNPRGLGDAA